jgi:hypothetical protein
MIQDGNKALWLQSPFFVPAGLDTSLTCGPSAEQWAIIKTRSHEIAQGFSAGKFTI